MKAFKKVISLALALVMVVGALVVLPTEAKAADSYEAFLNFVSPNYWPLNTWNITTGAANLEITGAGTYTFDIQMTTEGLGYSDAEGTTSTGIQYFSVDITGGWTMLAEYNLTDISLYADGVKVETSDVTASQTWVDDGTGTWVPSENASLKFYDPWNNINVFEDADAFAFTNSLKVSFTLEEKAEPIHTFKLGTEANKADGNFEFNIADYCKDFKAGDDLSVTIKASSDAYFKCVVGYGKGESYAWATSSELESNGGDVTLTCDIEDVYSAGQIQIWWLGDDCTYVDIYELTFTVKTDDSGNTGDDSSTDDSSTNDSSTNDSSTNDSSTSDSSTSDSSSEDKTSESVKDKTTVIFKDGAENAKYETNDASWLLNANDTDIITVVYTCADATHGNWGVLGWGASIGDTWVQPESLQYSAAENATDVVTVKMTVAEFKNAFGIKADSTVSYLCLGAWNGGQINSITLTTPSIGSKGDLSSTAIYMVVLMGAALVCVSVVAKKKMA